MSDRRSFSEIPKEVLREHPTESQIDRIWERLDRDLSGSAKPLRAFSRAGAGAFAVATFVLGVGVGARVFSSRPEPTPFVAAGPEARPMGAHALEPTVSAPAASTGHRQGAERARHSSVPRRIDLPSPASPVEAPEAPAPVTPSVDWRRLADEGQYAQALAALEASGGFDAALRDKTADQLMSLVDVARATGQRDRAITALRRVVSEHGSDPNAPVAAWMLGNELAKAHDLASAEQAFAMYRALSPGGDFAEDALARQVDMAVEQGHVEHARKLAGQYIKEFPSGPRAAELQAQLDSWGTAPAAEDRAQSVAPDGGSPR